MIVLDANVLLYAYHKSDPRHQRAKRWLERTLSSTEQVRLPWSSILAFVRIGTNPRVFEHPLTIQEAIAHVDSWLELPNVGILEAAERYWSILREVFIEAQAVGPLVSDAALAALAIEHGATLATTDRDFARFAGLKTLDPLRDAG
jgi:toxin-antitoxin system PIN domain toxin